LTEGGQPEVGNNHPSHTGKDQPTTKVDRGRACAAHHRKGTSAMQAQYGTDKSKAILVFLVGASGAPTLKAALNCSLIGSPSGTVFINGVSTTINTTGTGRYVVQLSDGPVVVAGTTVAGDNDNNTAVIVTTSGGTNGTAVVLTPTDITFGPNTPILNTTGGAVPAGQIEIDFGTAGATNPVSGTRVTCVFQSCYDGTNNTP
jgi:hypothetical protein